MKRLKFCIEAGTPDTNSQCDRYLETGIGVDEFDPLHTRMLGKRSLNIVNGSPSNPEVRNHHVSCENDSFKFDRYARQLFEYGFQGELLGRNRKGSLGSH